jgi:hypothetical protein
MNARIASKSTAFGPSARSMPHNRRSPGSAQKELIVSDQPYVSEIEGGLVNLTADMLQTWRLRLASRRRIWPTSGSPFRFTFASRLAKLHFGLRLGRAGECGPQGRFGAAARLLVAVTLVRFLRAHGRKLSCRRLPQKVAKGAVRHSAKPPRHLPQLRRLNGL